MSSEIGGFEAQLQGCLTTEDGALILSLRVAKSEESAARQCVKEIRTGLENGNKRLKTAFSWKREKRSLNANSYFHVLVDKIANRMKLGSDEIKVQMVLEYGTVAKENGEQLIVALPKSADVNTYYAYAKWIGDFTAKNGKPYSQYIFYKHTHTLDRSEMSRLIDGVVHEAKELGIETRSPEELKSLIESWEGRGE